MRTTTVLITGFGPFPAMPVNASATLARRLASAARRRFPSVRVVSSVLPTEWTAAPVRLAALYASHAPAIALHFGVSSLACGLEIERLAVNRCASKPDARGALPAGEHVRPGGAATLAASLPVADILARLAAMGLPASHSDDAGGYLCNALLYHSACHAGERASMAGFVHIPAHLPMVATAPGELTFADAIAGGLAILEVCLALRPQPAPR